MKLRVLTALLCASIGLGQNDGRSSLEHFRAGETLLQQGNLQSAANEFREALNGDLEPGKKAQSHIYLGRIFDMTGQRERAANEFKEAEHWIDLANETPTATVSETLEKTDPDYTEEARLAELEGIVSLSATISAEGTASDLAITHPLGLGLSEKAIEAVRKWRFKPGTLQGVPTDAPATLTVDFILPSKQSRWHLIRAEFHPPAGTSRPAFLSTRYPPGFGIGRGTLEEGRLLGAIGRLGTATVSFDVDENGIPARFQVERASDDMWGNEAVAVVRDWRFIPGAKDGVAVSVPCTVDLIWGPRRLTARAVAWGQTQLSTPADTFPPSASGFLRIRVGSSTQAAKLITKVVPEYPVTAKQAGVVGRVHFNTLIGADGRVVDLQVMSGHPLLVRAATEAVRQWMYQQTLLNGNPVEVTTEIVVDFAP